MRATTWQDKSKLTARTAGCVKRLSRYTGLLLAIAAMGAVGSMSAAPAESQDKRPAPAEQYKSLLKEFDQAAPIFWQATTDEERNKSVARVDPLPLKLLELAQNNPKEPFALDALIQVVSMEYWLNSHTSHPGWGKDS